MGKLTYFDSASTNETLNPSFSQWVQEVKDGKTKATSTACKKIFSLSNMGSTALKSHKKSEKHKKSSASVNDIQIKRTNIFVSNSKFESTSVSPVFKQDDLSSGSSALNDSNSTAKHDFKNNVQSSSSSIFFVGENITKAKILWTLHVSYKHYSYNSCSEIGQLFQKMFPDSSICQKFIFGKTKASYNITHGLAPYYHDLVYNIATTSLLSKLKLSESAKIQFRRECLDFFVGVFHKFQERCSLKYKLTRAVSSLNPNLIYSNAQLAKNE